MKKFIFLFVVILGLIISGYIYSIIFIKDIRADRAGVMAQEYISKLYPDFSIVGKNCQGEDTNGDSYVSCDIRIQRGVDAGSAQVVNLQCPTMWKSYTGNTCKESRIAIPGGE